MPYVGPDLPDLFDPGPVERAAPRLAKAGGEAIQDKAVMWTPTDTRNLKTAWYTLPPRKVALVAFPAYIVTVANNVSYAADVEFGTGLWGPSAAKYPIEPKTPGGVLSWINRRPFYSAHSGRVIGAGERLYARRVMHPGSRGKHMLARAVAYVDAQR